MIINAHAARQACLGAALGLSGVLAVVACTPEVPLPTPSSVVSPTESVLDWDEHGPITFAAPTDLTGATSEAISAWNKAHPDELVTYYELPVAADLRHSELKQRAQEKSGEFTLSVVDSQWLPELVATKAYAEIPKDVEPQPSVQLEALNAAKVDDKYYAIPYSLDLGLLYFRKDLVSSDAEIPKTFAQMETICAESVFRSDKYGAEQKQCYATPLSAGEDFTVSITEAALASGGRLLTSTGEVWAALDANNSGLRLMLSLDDAGYFSLKQAAEYSQTDVRRAFAAGEVLYYRDWGSGWAQLQLPKTKTGTLGLAAEQIGVARLPGTSDVTASVIDGRVLAFSRVGRNLGTAKSFAQWLTSPSQQLERFAKTGVLPVDSDILADPRVSKSLIGKVLLDALPTAQAPVPVSDYFELSRAIATELRPVVVENKSIGIAIDALKVRLGEIAARR